MNEIVKKFIMNIGACKERYDIDLYQDYNRFFLQHLFPQGEYTSIYDLFKAYRKHIHFESTNDENNERFKREVRVIDNKNELYTYIKEELNHQNKGENIRLYRGQFHAKWNCQSSLLRDFHKCYKPNQYTPDCRKRGKFFEFKNRHHQLWDDLLNSENLRDTITNTFRGMENIIMEDEMINRLTAKAEEYVAYLKKDIEQQGQPNAAKRELAAQHYGLPTSLVDFTTCLCVALYFAVNGEDISDDKKYIDNYLSIIHFDTEDKVINIEDTRGESLDSICQEMQTNEHAPQLYNQCKEWDMTDDSMQMDGNERVYYIGPTSWRNIENDRIIKQRGVLLCQSMYSNCSLEHVCKYGPHSYMPTLNCTLINKALIPDIKNFLGDRVTKEKLGLI